MRSLLWIGDAGCDTGFARSTHNLLEAVHPRWNVSVLGINYLGEPSGRQFPYDIYPAFSGGDLFGVGRVKELVEKLDPDVVVVQNDPWNFPRYLSKLKDVPYVIGIVAVDGLNCQGDKLIGLDAAVFWTQFGLQQAELGGFKGKAAVLPLGVDLDTYKPQLRRVAREQLLPPQLASAFIVGNVNRNQPRKRLDLTIAYFAEWVRTRNIKDAYLYLHVAPTGEKAFDCEQLARYYGVFDRLILFEPEVFKGVSEDKLALEYNCFDVQISTTQGEGFGLTTLEGMACGVPQIVPDWAALGDWPGEAVYTVPCTSTATTLDAINVIGGIPDAQLMITALDRLYHDASLRESCSKLGLELASRETFRWNAISQSFNTLLENFVDATICEERRQSARLRGGSTKALQLVSSISQKSREGSGRGDGDRKEGEHAPHAGKLG